MAEESDEPAQDDTEQAETEQGDTKLREEIRDLMVESLDRQNRFLWILVPIFAVLCIQTVLLITR
jgi:hypothetical protein